MVLRDELLAARERIGALERDLQDARLRVTESLPETTERLQEEKRALQAERARLVVERERLLDDLAKAREALAKSEQNAATVHKELTDARAIRDQLRRQAVDEAAQLGAAARKSEVPAAEAPAVTAHARTQRAPARAAAKPASRGMSTLDVFNRQALGAAPEHPIRAGVLCPACDASGVAHEMIHVRLGPPPDQPKISVVVCMSCGHLGAKRGG